MQNPLRLLVYLSVLFMLTACSKSTPSTQSLLLDPVQLKSEYMRCAQLPAGEAQTDPVCQEVISAATELKQLLIQASNQAQQFGVQLMAVQNQWVGAKSQLQQARAKLLQSEKQAGINPQAIQAKQQEVNRLKNTCAQLQFQIQAMLEAIKLLRSPQ